MAFDGRLLAINGDTFPLKFVFKESYNVVPKRLQDMDPYTTESGWLVRNPVEHEPSTISFETKPMWNHELAEMLNFITSRYSDRKRREVLVTYYNPTTDGYDTGTFYFNVNLEYNINMVDVENKRILYNSMQIDFIEN